MSPSYIISCGSTADLTAEELNAHDIRCVPYHYSVDGVEYTDDRRLPMSDFYAAMVAGADVHTAQVNVEEFRQYFRPFLESGQDILHVALSSGMSGSYNSARIAADLLSEEYPDRRIRIVDSLGASSGTGMLTLALAAAREAGKTVDEAYTWAENNKRRLHYWFCSSDLTFYVKGGRITRAAGWFGTILKICPVLNVDREGRMVPRFKVRGKKNALHELTAQMLGHADGGAAYDGNCCICHSDCRADAEAVAQEIRKVFPHVREIPIYEISPTIGCHTGPGTVALFFWGDEREE